MLESTHRTTVAQGTPSPHALTIDGLTVRFAVSRHGWLTAIENLDLTVAPSEIVGIVGESGCGKSTLMRSVLGLVPEAQGTVTLSALPGKRPAAQMVFQDPSSSLNPRMTVEEAILEALAVNGVHRGERSDRLRDLLSAVGLDLALTTRRPHQLSGGQRQRLAIARALGASPTLLLCDEPTAALDVSVRAQIVDLFRRLRSERGLTIVVVTHDLSVVAELADRLVVMYLGKIVENGPTAAVLENPSHPYTELLLSSLPGRNRRTVPNDAEPPSMITAHSGCGFRSRCPHAHEACIAPPPVRTVSDRHTVRCVLPATNSTSSPLATRSSE